MSDDENIDIDPENSQHQPITIDLTDIEDEPPRFQPLINYVKKGTIKIDPDSVSDDDCEMIDSESSQDDTSSTDSSGWIVRGKRKRNWSNDEYIDPYDK